MSQDIASVCQHDLRIMVLVMSSMRFVKCLGFIWKNIFFWKGTLGFWWKLADSRFWEILLFQNWQKRVQPSQEKFFITTSLAVHYLSPSPFWRQWDIHRWAYIAYHHRPSALYNINGQHTLIIKIFYQCTYVCIV